MHSRTFFGVMSFALLTLTTGQALAQNKAIYQSHFEDPVLKELEAARDATRKAQQEATDQVRKAQEARKAKEKAEARDLRSDMGGVVLPPSPESFKPITHFPPQAQYATNTCWSFSTTSFYESEIFRLTGKKIKLSEMYTVYFATVEKVRRFVRERGESAVPEGGELNDAGMLWKTYGIVPLEAYPGQAATTAGQEAARHDHTRLVQEVEALLQFIRKAELWDEQAAVAQLRLILDRYLGAPPTRFTFNGQERTPLEFLQKDTGLKLDDYVVTMSTLYTPFYTRGELRAPDNWWHSADYVNIPLDMWYAGITRAFQKGYSVAVGGDVSEPGKLGKQDVSFIPSFDIPEAYINQDAREYRLDNGSTADDHALHVVGYMKFKGKDWFLIKDSGRSARWGKFEGYYFWRGDFIKLKTMSYIVHKDVLKDVLEQVK